MRYRPEIDGLRTVAVLPVILFHTGLPIMAGGYVGVDIFFAISGFLITRTILTDEGLGARERIARFYERRIRRIFPALMFVAACSLAAGAVLQLPHEFIALAKSAFATVFFASNFWFWSQSGYFAAAAETMPLLHTWSLAVEEQFYIGFPIVMILLGLVRRWSSLALVLMALMSFLLTAYLTYRSPGVAFYWPVRSWELLAGALLAVLPISSARWGRQAISAMGIAAVVVAVSYFGRNTPFPGFAALLPVGGAVAIIYGGEDTLVGRILALRPLVFIGKISYSLYLWHWPVIAFTKRGLLVHQLTSGTALFCLALTFLLAVLSWKFIEKPFRRGRISRAGVFACGALMASTVMVVAGLVVLLRGFPERFTPEALSLANAKTALGPEGCRALTRDICQTGDAGEADYVLWGDSHAGAISPAVASSIQGPGLFGKFNECPPFGKIPDTLPGRDSADCRDHNRVMLRRAKSPEVKTIIVAGYWSSYEITASDAQDFVSALGDKRVVILGDSPTPGFDVPVVLALGKTPPKISRSTLPQALGAIRQLPNVTIIDLGDALCEGATCPARRGDKALYSDGNHISDYASREVVAPFLRSEFP